MIDGKPNYNFAPVKFLSIAAMFWASPASGGALYRLELAFPAFNLDLPWIHLGGCGRCILRR